MQSEDLQELLSRIIAARALPTAEPRESRALFKFNPLLPSPVRLSFALLPLVRHPRRSHASHVLYLNLILSFRRLCVSLSMFVCQLGGKICIRKEEHARARRALIWRDSAQVNCSRLTLAD